MPETAMKTRSRAGSSLIPAVLWLAVGTAAAAGDDKPRQEVLLAARRVIDAAGLATLITLDAQGQPQARVMDAFPPEEDFTVWMATHRSTRKVAQILSDPRTTLHYSNPAGASYVTLIGRSEVIEDPDILVLHWKEGWSAFYEDGPRGDDFLLIRFRPLRLEIVSIEHGIASEPRSWRPAIVEFETGKPR